MKVIFKYLLLLALIIPFATTTTCAQQSKAKTHKAKKTKKLNDDGEYYNGHKIYTGPRGGRYYINKNGNKTYI